MAQYKISDYYLDIKEVENLKPETQNIIHQYYNELLHGQINNGAGVSIFNTLFISGYLKSYIQEERDEKITKVLS